MVLCLASASTWAATVIVDDFSGSVLDPMWTVDDEPGNYAAGGGFAKAANHVRFNSIYIESYGHLETSVDTSNGVRVDAIMRQDHYPTSTWGMGAGIYFDEDNWVSIKQGAAGGQNGWMRDVMVDGTLSSAMSNAVNTLRVYWLIQGLELTDTEMIFYGSSITPMVDHFGQTDIDGNVSELTEFRMPKPASFTGTATVILGKGFTGRTYSGGTLWPNPDFDNNLSSTLTSPYFAGIDLARITIVPEPLTCILMLTGVPVLLRRRCR